MPEPLRTMNWVRTHDDRWDHLRHLRKEVRKWMKENPKRFEKTYWKWFFQWWRSQTKLQCQQRVAGRASLGR